ncbi:MAG TPA: hypothetical protein VHO70_16955 [Chitinispirillaceae bacterium]|nr:hypothetical protein [Chitinispirillaceae bacterium]
MKIIGSLLVIIFVTLTAEAAFVVLKGGKKGRIDIPDSSELYNSTLDNFRAISKNGYYNLLKQNVVYLVVENDTLMFIGNVAQRSTPIQHEEKTTISDELPQPLNTRNDEVIDDETTDYQVESPDRAVVIGIDNTKTDMHHLTEMESNRKVAIHGAVVYGVSLGLQYGIALPLNIAAVENGEQGLAIGSLIISVIAGGMSISGPTRCGVGASLTYDTNKKYHLGLDKNINWGFYRTGWALKAVYVVMYGLSMIDQSLAEALGFPAMIIDFVSAGMFITSVANASHYSRTGLNKVKHTSLKMDIAPVVSVENKCAGMVLNCSF